MNLCRATVRLILALMMISMLGLSLWGAKSGSHVLLPHTHQLDASTDDADAIESSELSATHLHKIQATIPTISHYCPFLSASQV